MRLDEITSAHEKLELLQLINQAIWQAFEWENGWGQTNSPDAQKATIPNPLQGIQRVGAVRNPQSPSPIWQPKKALPPKSQVKQRVGAVRNPQPPSPIRTPKTDLKAPVSTKQPTTQPTDKRPFDALIVTNDNHQNKARETDRHS